MVANPSQIAIEFPQHVVVNREYPLQAVAMAGSQVLSGHYAIQVKAASFQLTPASRNNWQARCTQEGPAELEAQLPLYKDVKKVYCQLPLLNLGVDKVRLHPDAWYRLPVIGGSDGFMVRVEPTELATIVGMDLLAKKTGKGKIFVKDRLAADN